MSTAQLEDLNLGFEHSYRDQLEGMYQLAVPDGVPQATLIYFNESLAAMMNIAWDQLDEQQRAAILSGSAPCADMHPIAQAYAGHQFGQFNPGLGDGRAHLLGEWFDSAGQRFDLALKGSGRTPFSRGGDGKGAIGPMLREMLISESMHALGVPTTRCLAVLATGEKVFRDRLVPGAILARTAASHIRVGTFQFAAMLRDGSAVQRLADYAIGRHFPELDPSSDTLYLEFLDAVMDRQARLVAQWIGLGFIHGVMNTDNMAISGETIDYGPCAFMNRYDPATVFSSIDTGGRYQYQNQSAIAQWNLARFAETLLPLLSVDQEEGVELATRSVNGFVDKYNAAHCEVFSRKLGLDLQQNTATRQAHIADWLRLLEAHQADFTMAHRVLCRDNYASELRSLLKPNDALEQWLKKHAELTHLQARQSLSRINPAVIPRNHLVEQALSAATETGDASLALELLQELRRPYDDKDRDPVLMEPATLGFDSSYRTFCGT